MDRTFHPQQLWNYRLCSLAAARDAHVCSMSWLGSYKRIPQSWHSNKRISFGSTCVFHVLAQQQQTHPLKSMHAFSNRTSPSCSSSLPDLPNPISLASKRACTHVSAHTHMHPRTHTCMYKRVCMETQKHAQTHTCVHQGLSPCPCQLPAAAPALQPSPVARVLITSSATTLWLIC